jgi:hypothetical protein
VADCSPVLRDAGHRCADLVDIEVEEPAGALKRAHHAAMGAPRDPAMSRACIVRYQAALVSVLQNATCGTFGSFHEVHITALWIGDSPDADTNKSAAILCPDTLADFFESRDTTRFNYSASNGGI